MEKRQARVWLSAYLFTVAAVGAALGLSFLLRDIVEGSPFLLFWPVVVFSGWYGGRRAGLLAALLTTAAIVYFIVATESQASFDTEKILATSIFLLLSVPVSWISGMRRTVEEEAQRARDWLGIVLTSIGDGVIATDTEGTITFINPVTSALTGWREQEAIGRAIQDVFHIVNEQTRQPVENPIARVLIEGTVVGLANHTVLITRDGTERPIDDSGAPIRDRDGTIIGAVLVFRDVTERKQAERKQAELAAIVQSSDDTIISKDMDGIILSWNPGAEHMYGYTADEMIGRSISELVPSDLQDDFPKIMERLRRGERIDHYETQRITKDGRRLDVSLSISPIRDSSGRIVAAAKIARDITEQKQAQRKQAELAAIVQSSDDTIISMDLNGIILSWNPGAERMYGYTAEEVIGKSISVLIPPDLTDDFPSYMERWKRGERIEHFETQRITKDGRRLDVSLSISPIRDSSGRIVAAAKIARDITEWKRASEAVRESEKRFRTMADTIPGCVWTAKPGGSIDYANKYWYEFSGLTEEQTAGLEWASILHPDDLERTLDVWTSAARQGIPYELEARNRRTDGQWRWLLNRAVPTKDEAGAITGWIGTSLDITEMKEAQETLRRSEAQLRLLLEAAPEAVIITNQDGQIILVNAQAEHSFGYSRDEMLGKPIEMLMPERFRNGHGGYRADYITAPSARLMGVGRDLTGRRKDGSEFPIEVGLNLVETPEGPYIVSFVADITMRKRTEAALRESEERLRIVLENMPVMLAAGGDEGSFLVWNRECERVTGYRASEIVGNPQALDLLIPDADYREQVLSYWREHEGNHRDFEVMFTTRNGERRYVSWLSISQQFPVPGWASWAVGVDITPRKQIGESLERERTLLRTILDSIPVMIVLYEPDTSIVNLNKEFERVTGWTSEEARGISLMEEIYPDPEYRERTRQAMETLAPGWHDRQMRTRDGRVVESSWSNIRLDDGTQIGIGIDITERKRAEERLRASQQQFSAIFDNALDAILVADDEGRYVDANPAASELMGTPRDKLIGMYVADFSDPALKREEFEHIWAAFLEAGHQQGVEYPVYRADGTIRIAEYSAKAHFLPHRHVSFLRDVTERKRTEARANILHRLTAALAQSLTPEQVADAIVTHGMEVVGANAGSVVLLVEDGTMLEVLHSAGYPADLIQSWQRFPVDTPSAPLATCVRTGEPVWLNSPEERDSQFPPDPVRPRTTNFGAWAAIPLVVNDNVIGALGLSFLTRQAFKVEDRRFMVAVAQQCAQALERARLYQAEQQARAHAESRAMRIAQLQAVTAALSETFTVAEVAKVVVDASVAALDAASGALNLLVDDGATFEVVYSSGSGLSGQEQAAYRRFPADLPFPVRDAVRDGEPLWFETNEALVARYPAVAAVAQTYPGAWTILPLVAGGHTFGAFGVNFNENRRFSEEDRSFMEALAHQCAQALERVRLIEQEKSKAVLEERQRIARDLHDAVSQTLFAANVMAQSLPRLWDRQPETIPGRLGELARLTQGAASEMRVLLLELRPTVLLESKLNDLLNQLIQIAQARSKQLSIRLSCEGNMALPADVHLTFYRVAQEALNNIIKHSSATEASVDCILDSERVELRINDNGRGFKLNDSTSGFGLEMMRERAAEVGAALVINTTVGQGTEVSLVWEGDGNAGTAGGYS